MLACNEKLTDYFKPTTDIFFLHHHQHIEANVKGRTHKHQKNARVLVPMERIKQHCLLTRASAYQYLQFAWFDDGQIRRMFIVQILVCVCVCASVSVLHSKNTNRCMHNLYAKKSLHRLRSATYERISLPEIYDTYNTSMYINIQYIVDYYSDMYGSVRKLKKKKTGRNSTRQTRNGNFINAFVKKIKMDQN